jgi:inhibitor of KinA
VTIRPSSDSSLLVTFGDRISPEAHRQVLRLTRRLESARKIRNLHPAFTSVLVEFDPRRARAGEIEELIRARLQADGEEDVAEPPARLIEIPVRYGGEFGPDLEDVARHAGLEAGRVVELHASAEYEVYFLGFATFFVYLGGLPAEIATPRLAAPRRQVPAGSVGIAGGQTGIYPLASPGGWRIIGRTGARLFDPQREPPPLVRMGDRVRFVAVPEDRA